MSGAFDKQTREIVFLRAKMRCEMCGSQCRVAHFHHRRPRGMGGTRRIESSRASNCLFVHPRCHAEIESSRERALVNGWLVRQVDSPLLVPVKLWSGLWFLDDDGGMSRINQRPDVNERPDLLPDEGIGDASDSGVLGNESLDGTLTDAK